MLLSLAMAGCGTIYSDTFSSKPNHFVPAPRRDLPPADPTQTAPGDVAPPNPAGAPVAVPPQPAVGNPAVPAAPAAPVAPAAPADAAVVPGL